jgi:hypothetical protein
MLLKGSVFRAQSYFLQVRAIPGSMHAALCYLAFGRAHDLDIADVFERDFDFGAPYGQIRRENQ